MNQFGAYSAKDIGMQGYSSERSLICSKALENISSTPLAEYSETEETVRLFHLKLPSRDGGGIALHCFLE